MLSISKAVLKEEITLALRILNKWDQKLEQGVPGQDFPVQDEVAFEHFVREMVGEFQVVSSKFDGLATILAEDRMG